LRLSLLEEVAEDRFRFHDLVRIHARELAESAPAAEQQAAVGRAVDWYLDHAVAADLVVIPGRWHLGGRYERTRADPPAFSGAASALAWLEGELPGLAGAVAAANGMGLHEEAWQLCEALWGLLLYRRPYATWIEVTRVGAESARSCGNARAEARMRDQLGFAFLCLHRHEEAQAEFRQAASLACAAGDRLGEAAPLEHLGLALLGTGRPAEALSVFEAVRAIHAELGRQRGIALMTRRVGEALRDAGRPAEAIRSLSEARDMFARLPDPYNEARSSTELARVLLQARRRDEAASLLESALVVMSSRGATDKQAGIHVMLADAAGAAGDEQTAGEHLAMALAIYDSLGASEAAAVRERLTGCVTGGRHAVVSTEQAQTPSAIPTAVSNETEGAGSPGPPWE
jgi:tetratricopeptide (TPR) repeat protein